MHMTTVENLSLGEYAILNEDYGSFTVMGMSQNSFKPRSKNDANVVCLETGSGAIAKSTPCRRVSVAEALANVAKHYKL